MRTHAFKVAHVVTDNYGRQMYLALPAEVQQRREEAKHTWREWLYEYGCSAFAAAVILYAIIARR